MSIARQIPPLYQAQAQRQLLTRLQSEGLRLSGPDQEHVSRRGGAGPSDHQAITIGNTTVMVPVFSETAWHSHLSLAGKRGNTLRDHLIPVADVTFTPTPKFYQLYTEDGIPYEHIATLHGRDVLATTVLQTCVRYDNPRKACRFCAIGQSLAAGRTVARKTPEQLAEVAKAAVALDGVKHMVMTTGTPPTRDRGAQILCESVAAVKAAVDIPIQVQCEPPADLEWLDRLKAAGADSIGLHLEAVTPEVRAQMMPGKAEVGLEVYMAAFEWAVASFGQGQVSTYILAGLGDRPEDILATSYRLIEMGVYPFVVPFVPLRGTPLERLTPPSAEFMQSILEPLGRRLANAGLRARDIKAGCGRCGACSTLSLYEEL